MKVTRLEEAVKYSPPKHTETCHAMFLQHKNQGCDAPYWVGCSYYLPGAKAEWDASPLDKIYIVLEGELPSPLNPPNGCHFHPRCFMAKDNCYTEKPILRQINSNHWVACHWAV